MKRNSLASIETIIKRVNERFTDIKRAVNDKLIPEGVLKNWQVAFDKISSAAGVNLTKSGNLSHGKKMQENVDLDDLEGLLERRTAGEVKQDIKWGAVETFGEDYTQEDITEYSDDMGYIYGQLAENYKETYDAFDAKFGGTQGKKSYKELKQAIEEWKDLSDAERNIKLAEAKERKNNAVNRIFT